MPTQLASLDSLVHPHQIEVQEFSSYALVIDARSAEAYQEDHIPGAVSVPVATQRLRVTGTEGAALVAGDTELSVLYALAAHLGGLSAGASVLVYCDRGGLDSLVWADPIKALGYQVDVLGGGWGNYRRWVDAGLDMLPRALTFRRLVAPPVGGLCTVLERLAKLGEQVLDLTVLAGQRLVPGLTLPGDQTPSQASFDTALLHALRRFDPRQPVWVRDVMGNLGKLALAPSLRDALLRSETQRLELPLEVRARAWLSHMQASRTELASITAALFALGRDPTVPGPERWANLLHNGSEVEGLSELIRRFLDPLFRFESLAVSDHAVQLSDLSPRTVDRFISNWDASARD